LTAQVFTKGWDSFRTEEKIKNPSAYLYQIARAEIANHYRKGAKFQIISTEANPIPDPQPTAEENSGFKSDIDTLRISLSQLNDDYQNVIIWRYLEGYSNKEIAWIMERQERTVRVMVHRALKELREKMR